jgi:hypothetical protein
MIKESTINIKYKSEVFAWPYKNESNKKISDLKKFLETSDYSWDEDIDRIIRITQRNK